MLPDSMKPAILLRIPYKGGDPHNLRDTRGQACTILCCSDRTQLSRLKPTCCRCRACVSLLLALLLAFLFLLQLPAS